MSDSREDRDGPTEQEGSQIWDGITRAETLSGWATEARQRIADAGKNYDWDALIAAVEEHPKFVNAARPGGTSLYAPLHQAAHGGAPVRVTERLIELGAWRTLQNAHGERPVDVARRRRHEHVLGVLEPQLARQVPWGVLCAIQKHFTL